LEFPFNISAAVEDSDFKFGMLLGFAKGHYKITPKEKSGRGAGLANYLLCSLQKTKRRQTWI